MASCFAKQRAKKAAAAAAATEEESIKPTRNNQYRAVAALAEVYSKDEKEFIFIFFCVVILQSSLIPWNHVGVFVYAFS